ncbi:hypothetical protein JRO89_XS08G0111000 [Xanthoceras sorbifolium]|uniref:Protein kinase domain-containing protein n=1 Tax=Xanthoceras sorbifolium TaxID=99658 RepID=A0ABQ8HP90_9ROSI|nr:hypothetical protein JRO89_XS08G0111000 [Xanthoceras sorbifolium]
MGNCWGSLFSQTNPSSTTTTTTNSINPGTSNDCRNNTEFSGTSSSIAGRSQFSQAVSEAAVVVEEEGDPKGGQILETPNLKIFTFADLKAATRNFKPDNLLGVGGFGRVYKGWIDEKTLAPSKSGLGMSVAINKLNPESVQGLEEWQSEVNFLGRLSHPNLVKLLGYCWEDKELLLVYEHMQKGSLENHLFRRHPAIEPLSWDIRFKIAIGAARGLAFLHTSKKRAIYRDFKASNILLDGNYNAKISDFGLAKLGPDGGESHVTTRIMGTYGYAAPEYENLVDWLKPTLSHKRKLKTIMDVRMEGQYTSKAALQAAQLTLKCLELDPKNRPSMREVLEALEQIEAMKEKPKNSKFSSLQSKAHRHAHAQPHMDNSHRQDDISRGGER